MPNSKSPAPMSETAKLAYESEWNGADTAANRTAFVRGFRVAVDALMNILADQDHTCETAQSSLDYENQLVPQLHNRFLASQ